MSVKDFRILPVEENHKRVCGFKFEWATLIGAPLKKLKKFNRELADSTEVSPQIRM